MKTIQLPAQLPPRKTAPFLLPRHTKLSAQQCPARVRILNIFCSDSESPPPLEVLIIAPTFDSDKRMSLGTMACRAKLDGPPKCPCPWTRARHGFARRIPPALFPFRSAFSRTRSNCFSRLVRSSSASFSRSMSSFRAPFQRSNYFVEFQMSALASRFCVF
jgi:hypothetical protein